MSREYGNGIQSHAVDTDHSRVFVFILDVWGNGTNADAHGSDEDKGVKLFPQFSYLSTTDDLGTEFSLQRKGDVSPRLADLDNGDFHIIALG